MSALTFSACSESNKTTKDNLEKADSTTEITESGKKPTMSVQEKKQRFKNLLAQPIVNEYKELYALYNKINMDIVEGTESELIATLKAKYKASTNDELLNALKPHPPSVALAQAAMESAWATSRFFNEANNVFGVWSHDENDPRIAALVKRDGKTIWVKKYASIREAVKDYYFLLAKGGAFKEFRALKMTTTDPYEFVTKLDKYSEKGSVYGEELAAMIRYNKFDSYDVQACCDETD